MKLSALLNNENLNNEKINEIIFNGIEYHDEIAKYALVFGHPEYLTFRVQRAIALYKMGRIEKIILSGGIGAKDTVSTESEAIKMKRIAIAQGIPEEDLILEDKSTTTIENVQNVANYFKEIKYEGKEIILISSVWHMRRCLAIAKKYLLMFDNFYFAPAHDNVAEENTWMNTELGKKLVGDEIYYLRKHISQNRIADLEIKNL